MSTAITPAIHLRIHELLRDDYPVADVAKMVNIHPKTVAKYGRISVEGSDYTAVAEHKLDAQYKALKAKYDDLVESTGLVSQADDFLTACLNRKVVIPKWIAEPRLDAKRIAIPTLQLSDWHYDEYVDPKQVNFLNGYDRPIAEQRTKNCFQNTLKMCFDFIKGLTYDGIVVAVLGDMFSGFIHEELAETNVASMMESCLYWLEPVGAGLKLLADEFGQVLVPWVVGNHPRNSRKPRHKGRVTDNFDWLFGQFLARLFAMDSKYRDKVTFNISTASDIEYSIYGTRFLGTHGDQFRGGTGIAGALSPLMIGYHRKVKRAIATHRPFDYMLAGHWHQSMYFKGIIANGSGKGHDEFAGDCNFDFEKPKQNLFMTQPNHGVTFTDTVHCLSDNEPWMKQAA